MSRTGLRGIPAWVVIALLLTAAGSALEAQEEISARDLSAHLAGLVTRMHADLHDVESLEPLLVVQVLHDRGGYRVRASGRLERLLVDALARNGLRVVDESSRRRILDRLERCYTEDAPFCQPERVIGTYRPAGGMIEGFVRAVEEGVELRMRLVSAVQVRDAASGEVLGSWRTVLPARALDPESDLDPVRGTVSLGIPISDRRGDPPSRPGELQVDVRTHENTPAWVHVDGRGYGSAPVTLAASPGRHLLTVTASGHQPHNEYVELSPGGVTRRRITLERGRGGLRILSSVDSARVWIDGTPVGRTPLERALPVAAGEHRVELRREGFDPGTWRVRMEHGDTAAVQARLREHPGSIVVSCSQDSVRVTLDGRRRGRCTTDQALTLEDVPAGYHRVRGSRRGRTTRSHRVRVRGDAAVAVTLTLEQPAQAETRKEKDGGESSDSGARETMPYAGVYMSVGYVQGRSSGTVSEGSSSGDFDVGGRGARAGLQFRANGWGIEVNGTFTSLDPMGSAEGEHSYFDAGLEVTRYLTPRSTVQPYLAARAHWGILSLRRDDGLAGAESEARGLGWGGSVGLELRLSRRSALVAGATYTRTTLGPLERHSTTFGDTTAPDSVEDWAHWRAFLLLRWLPSGFGRSD